MMIDVTNWFINGFAAAGLVCLFIMAVDIVLRVIGIGLQSILHRIMGFDWVVLAGYAVMVAVFVFIFMVGK